MATAADFPHLAGESPEFVALADAEAVVGAVTIPLHSHILAKSSKVCAQLFSSLSDGPSSPKAGAVDVGPLFSGEPMEVVLLLVLLMYNPGAECVRQTFVFKKWGLRGQPPGVALVADPAMTPQLLQAAVRLADKLDVLGVLDAVEALATEDWTGADTLGWFIEARRMGLNRLVGSTLFALARRLTRRSSYIAPAGQAEAAAATLRDPRWAEMEPAAMLLVLEAVSAYQLSGAPSSTNPFPSPPRGERGWAAPGDLLAATLPRSQGAGVAHAVPADLLGMADLQLAQAEDDYDEEWATEDDGGSEEESQYTTTDSEYVGSEVEEEEGAGPPWAI